MTTIEEIRQEFIGALRLFILGFKKTEEMLSQGKTMEEVQAALQLPNDLAKFKMDTLKSKIRTSGVDPSEIETPQMYVEFLQEANQTLGGNLFPQEEIELFARFFTLPIFDPMAAMLFIQMPTIAKRSFIESMERSFTE